MQLRVVAHQCSFKVGDLEGNSEKIIQLYREFDCDLVVFPELSLTGYNCKDLFLDKDFLARVDEYILKIAKLTGDKALLIGASILVDSKLFNAAILLRNGKIEDVYNKHFLPNYDVFDEKRYFQPGSELSSIFEINGCKIRVLICEDLWHPEVDLDKKDEACEVAVVMNASPYAINKTNKRVKLLQEFSKKYNHKYVIYLNLVGAHDHLLFDGESMIVSGGEVIAIADKWQELSLSTISSFNTCDKEWYTHTKTNASSTKNSVTVDFLRSYKLINTATSHLHFDQQIQSYINQRLSLSTISSFNAENNLLNYSKLIGLLDQVERANEQKLNNILSGSDIFNLTDEVACDIYNGIILALREYSDYAGCNKFVVGLSGGIDSALVAVMAVDAFGAENVLCVAMPSKYSTQISFDDAKELVNRIRCQLEVVPINEIKSAFDKTLQSVIGILDDYDLTNENIQPRIRANILMAIANKQDRLLLCTSNKSESAVGYSTLYGDMTGAYAPIVDIYKTQVYDICRWRNRLSDVIPKTILEKEPSAELRPDQKDSDSLPDYRCLDEILYNLIELRCDPKGFDQLLVERVKNLLYKSEFKRFQAPPGPKINNIMLSRDRRYPICLKLNSK